MMPKAPHAVAICSTPSSMAVVEEGIIECVCEREYEKRRGKGEERKMRVGAKQKSKVAKRERERGLGREEKRRECFSEGAKEGAVGKGDNSKQERKVIVSEGK